MRKKNGVRATPFEAGELLGLFDDEHDLDKGLRFARLEVLLDLALHFGGVETILAPGGIMPLLYEETSK